MNHIAIVQELYAAFGRGDIPAILERLAEDIRWDQESAGHGIPWIQPRRGRANVLGFFQSLGDLDFKKFEPRVFLEGSGYVAAVVYVDLIVKATGKHFSDTEVHLWKFDDAGRVSDFRHYVDTHAQLLAMQP